MTASVHEFPSRPPLEQSFDGGMLRLERLHQLRHGMSSSEYERLKGLTLAVLVHYVPDEVWEHCISSSQEFLRSFGNGNDK